MTTELPSINSTTSISDNVDLRNYYDNLLFKNNSGKSLTDLPRKANAVPAPSAGPAIHQNGKHAHALSGQPLLNNRERQNKEEKHIDFINGFNNSNPNRSNTSHRLPFTSFQMTPSNSEPIPPSSTPPASQEPLLHQHRQTVFNMTNAMPMMVTPDDSNNIPHMSFDFDRNNTSQPSYYSNQIQQNYNPNNTLTHSNIAESPFYQHPGSQQTHVEQQHQQQQQQHFGARRSSYISDTLIHGQLDVTNQSNIPMFNNPSYLNSENGMTQISRFSGIPTTSFVTSQMGPPTTAPAIPYSNMISQQQQQQQQKQRRNTQPVNCATAPSTAAYNATQIATGTVRNRYLNYSKQQQLLQSKEVLDGQVSLDNGLILINAQQIASSKDLKALYADCGSNYFSSKQVFEFTDYIKSMLTTTNASSGSKKFQAVSKFLTFLKSCNLNYNPQSDAFVSEKQISTKSPAEKNATLSDNSANTNNKGERKSSSTSSYLHYKPLVLVALKNGKLELLSTPQNTNILMQRGDLVIIDGDRGKDLALVVEPTVGLDLALFINFLKKKIHFDSLITSKSQHHANSKFIQALTDSTKGQGDELNSKLYDVIELTQLIVPSKQILRFATPWEATTNLHNKFQDELKALHIAQIKLKSLNSGLNHHHHHAGTFAGNETAPVNGTPPPSASNSTINRPQLNIKILNAEFQFDRKKLTFYYVCEERNDFRELIKELFKFYKTRIWLCAIPNNLGIDLKYYDSQHKELGMYKEMMQHYAMEDLTDANVQQGGGFIVAPPLNKIELDDFQIGVYKELVDELFD